MNMITLIFMCVGLVIYSINSIKRFRSFLIWPGFINSPAKLPHCIVDNITNHVSLNMT